MKANIARYEWARTAWEQTKANADAALAASPRPAAPTGDFRPRGPDPCGDSREGWRCGLYMPGLTDGHRARNLALAYAVTGDRKYADKAKEFALAWARLYNPPAPLHEIGHAVAEPVGAMLKLFMAYDLTEDAWSALERSEFRRWAALFVDRGKRAADGARDRPWDPHAPYTNSATWARALAVWAAAVAGEPYLSETLAWNYAHTTPGGHDYGWLHLLDRAMNGSGKMYEEGERKSIGYALYAWHPLALIADVSKRVGGEHKNLWTVTTANGKGLLLVAKYYEPYLTRTRDDPYGADNHLRVMSEYRAAMELAHKNFPDSPALRRIVAYGGPSVRGSNFDGHITGHNALTGVPVTPTAGT